MLSALLWVLCVVQVYPRTDSSPESTIYYELLADQHDETMLLQTFSRVFRRTAIAKGASSEDSRGSGIDIISEDLRIGEEGELVVPSISAPRARYAVKPDEDLKMDAKVLKEQMHLESLEHDAEAALSKLKAKTYQSANFTHWRNQQYSPKLSRLRRLGMLASANMDKAELAHDATERAGLQAYFEKSIHKSEEAAKLQRERRMNISTRSGMESSASLERDIQLALSSNRRGNMKDWEAKVLANVTRGLNDSGFHSFARGMSDSEAEHGDSEFQRAYEALLAIAGVNKRPSGGEHA